MLSPNQMPVNHNTLQVVMIAYGSGSNGKVVLMDTITINPLSPDELRKWDAFIMCANPAFEQAVRSAARSLRLAQPRACSLF